MNSNEKIEFLVHHFRLFGLDSVTIATRVIILDSPGAGDCDCARQFAMNGGIVIALVPREEFSSSFDLQSYPLEHDTALGLNCVSGPHHGRYLRSFHGRYRYEGSGEVLISDGAGLSVWLFVPLGSGGVLCAGTALADDILRYRQGDPMEAANRPTGAMWGIAGERPNYLFEKQLEGLPKHDRQADYWVKVLVDFVAAKLGVKLQPMLPGGAPGAIVITGDDDQAYLEKYEEQLKLLGKTPITYFLHPQTRHTRETLKSMLGKKWIDLGLHPDALDAPDQYRSLLKVQSSWYKGLVGKRAVSLRNHGFLNDGYWGHLDAWLEEGLLFSSNLPGLDGRVLNGSLLPARLSFDGKLTSHWSILTAIGDGVRFISGMTDADAARCILDMADRIRNDIVPGVMVLNLHPQNVAETRAMHRAVLQVIDSGFVAWTVRECMGWFQNYDNPMPQNDESDVLPSLTRWWKKIVS
jgi:hypothetical protein